ncbi:MAG: MarR family transcriptional regulator [Peptococcaceae bacterium]|jgi:DNA-binding PadR family transcriptional regulator|nr:MarR family transcriptional regulator [Peptococcaceae bacterium]
MRTRQTTDAKKTSEKTKRVKLTERDRKLLEDILRLRTLTSKQIRRLYFNGTGSTGVNRISELKRAGLIRPSKVIRDGRKVDTCFFITPEGARAIGHDAVRAKKNQASVFKYKDEESSLKLQDYYIMRSEIYATLSPEWHWEDSREVKARLRMNRATPIAGVLRSGENAYAVYLLSKNPEDETLKKVQESVSFVRTARNLPKSIVLCENLETVDRIIEKYRPGQVYVMPFELGLKMLALNESPYSLLARVYGEHPILNTARRYAHYETVINGERFLVNELLYNNLETISALRYYTRDVYAGERLRLIALTEQSRLDYYARLFDRLNYPHFVWQTVDIEKLFEEKRRSMPS